MKLFYMSYVIHKCFNLLTLIHSISLVNYAVVCLLMKLHVIIQFKETKTEGCTSQCSKCK